MSSLDKLAIRGIRSFDHNDLSVMQFYTPLTVIVGANGSGKTTIIECLKYATTGDLPPNTKGGAFVHDPSIAGTSEVKAAVKLRFWNTKKEKMTVDRRLQVTKKKGGPSGAGLTMKTLEGVISYADENKDTTKRQSLSTRCAALDEEVPKQLGVSKAILENVIFCHQEESNWPLSEPGALKKKFDDIFEATKYTKALDNIKQLRKEQAVEIKVDKEKLSALKTDRDRAVKLRATIEKLSASIELKTREHAALESEIVKIVAENTRFQDQATQFSEIMGKAELARERRKLVESALGPIRASLTELKDTDDELAVKITNHTANLDLSKAARIELQAELERGVERLSEIEVKRSRAQTGYGKLQAEKQRHAETVNHRLKLVKELAEKHQIQGYGRDLSEAQLRAFEDDLKQASRAQQKKIEDMKKASREQERERQQMIQDLRSALTTDQRVQQNAADSLKMLNAEINVTNSELDRLTTTNADVTYHESGLEAEKKRKTDLELMMAEANYKQMIDAKQKEQREVDSEREELFAQQRTLASEAEDRAKLSLKREALRSKEGWINTHIEMSSARFLKHIGKAISRETMDADVSSYLLTAERNMEEAENKSREAARGLDAIDSGVASAREKVHSLENEISASLKMKQLFLDQSLQDIAHLPDSRGKPETLEEMLGYCEESVELARTTLEKNSQALQFFDIVEEKAFSKHICFACNRHFDEPALKLLKTYLAMERNKRSQKTAEKNKHDLEWWQDFMREVQVQLVESDTQYSRLAQDLDTATKSKDSFDKQVAEAASKAVEASFEVSQLKEQRREVEILKRTAYDVVKESKVCEELSREISRLETHLSSSGSVSTSDEISEKLSNLGLKYQNLNAALEKFRTEEQKHRNSIETLKDSIRSTERSLDIKRQEIKERENLEKLSDEQRTKAIQLEHQVKELDVKIREANEPIRNAEDELALIRVEAEAAESQETRLLQTYHNSHEQLDSNDREIRQYQSRGGDVALLECEAELKGHEVAIANTKDSISSLRQQLAKIDNDLADSSAVLRNMEDNRRMRESTREIQRIEAEIKALDEDGARKAYRKFDAEYTQMRKKQSDMQAQQAKLGGEIEMMNRDLSEKGAELKSEYDNIDQKYKTELIKVKTAEVANSDLEKYGKALDSAIMTFHGHKMREINNTIAELWTQTYQGTDIDNIMIKSDSEGKAVGARSYNYRVVMVKDTTEMDMRGRCSAGQKVLASIIIRLALAESFGVNCGIMALDEPTTNLDRENILALGASLAALIKDRKGQSNFQLIVITHDESFLETLGSSGALDKYWRVSRGDGGLVSHIERQRLNY